MGNSILQKNIGELFLDYDEQAKDYILSKHYEYIIPSYQRAYKWDEELGEILFMDLIKPKGEGYNFGFITLSIIDSKNKYLFEIIDGQQRITTVYIIMMVLYNRLCILSAGDHEKKRLSKFIENFPFISKDSPTIPHLSFLYNEVESSDLEDKINKDNPIFNNFKKVNEALSIALRDCVDDDAAIGQIVQFVKYILNQKIIVLKYETPALALDSFIALNMKGRPLDTYEIFSALCLKIIDSPEEMDAYKIKLNNIYNLYFDNSKLLGFKSFDQFLKSMIVCMDYGTYNNDSDKMGEIQLKMPNHYIEETYKSPTSIMNFIDRLDRYLKAIIIFLEKGELSGLSKFTFSANSTQNIKQREMEIKWLVYGWHNNEIDRSMLIVIRRYIYALIIQIMKIDDAQDEDILYKKIFNSMTEIVLSLYHHHLISILGSDYVKLRAENIIISSAHDIRKFYSNTLDSEEIFSAELKNSSIAIGIQKNKFLRLSLLFQLKGIEKKDKLSLKGKIIEEIIPFDALNIEHFIIDKSRYKISEGRNKYLFNTILVKKIINDKFAEEKCKNCKNKIEFLQDKVFLSHKKEMEFLCFYIKSLSDNLEKLSEKYDKEQNFHIFIDLIENQKSDLTEKNIGLYREYMNEIMINLFRDISSELKSVLKMLTYENNCKVFH